MTFLGLTGYSSDWIGECAEIVTPLRKIMKEAGHTSLRNSLQWNEEAEVAFNTIKQELLSAPALALPDYEKVFRLNVSNRQEGYAAAVLTQETGTGKTERAGDRSRRRTNQARRSGLRVSISKKVE
ncbi:uncharacterized protein LOC134348919 [Mobula hypostoma]|uniref:uncharacterized protein LOC134348919 n=1 Tax=Mobula hypostoma TaxID=723540 RepID=UPI002FC3277F